MAGTSSEEIITKRISQKAQQDCALKISTITPVLPFYRQKKRSSIAFHGIPIGVFLLKIVLSDFTGS